MKKATIAICSFCALLLGVAGFFNVLREDLKPAPVLQEQLSSPDTAGVMMAASSDNGMKEPSDYNQADEREILIASTTSRLSEEGREWIELSDSNQTLNLESDGVQQLNRYPTEGVLPLDQNTRVLDQMNQFPHASGAVAVESENSEYDKTDNNLWNPQLPPFVYAPDVISENVSTPPENESSQTEPEDPLNQINADGNSIQAESSSN